MIEYSFRNDPKRCITGITETAISPGSLCGVTRRAGGKLAGMDYADAGRDPYGPAMPGLMREASRAPAQGQWFEAQVWACNRVSVPNRIGRLLFRVEVGI